jgi:hypothetical protein
LSSVRRWSGPTHFLTDKKGGEGMKQRKLRRWMEANLPLWLLGIIDWPKYRFIGYCWAEGCGRLMVLHPPWRLFICENTPMAIKLTDRGQFASYGVELVAPVSRAS